MWIKRRSACQPESKKFVHLCVHVCSCIHVWESWVLVCMCVHIRKSFIYYPFIKPANQRKKSLVFTRIREIITHIVITSPSLESGYFESLTHPFRCMARRYLLYFPSKGFYKQMKWQIQLGVQRQIGSQDYWTETCC